ncbi:unnamed protein product, partial [Dicrocoelium dendriticum]
MYFVVVGSSHTSNELDGMKINKPWPVNKYALPPGTIAYYLWPSKIMVSWALIFTLVLLHLTQLRGKKYYNDCCESKNIKIFLLGFHFSMYDLINENFCSVDKLNRRTGCIY